MRKPKTPEYLVVAANNRWAAHWDLSEAIRSCGLREQSVLDNCAAMIESRLEYGEEINWGWLEDEVVDVHDSHWRSQPIDMAIYYIDTEVWTGYEVSDFDGSVTFYGFEGTDEEQLAAIEVHKVVATWKGGAIVKQEIPNEAAA